MSTPLGYNANTARLFDPNSQVNHTEPNDPQKGLSRAPSMNYQRPTGYGIDMSAAYARPGAGVYGMGTNVLGRVVPQGAAQQLNAEAEAMAAARSIPRR